MRSSKAPALLFAIALLACGQSSSIIATVAGQSVSEGFIQWSVSVRLELFIFYSISSKSLLARCPETSY